MILPMVHFSFLIYHKGYHEFLRDIRDIAVVHIVEKEEWLNKEGMTQYDLIKDLKDTIKYLSKRTYKEFYSLKLNSGLLVLENVNRLRTLLAEYEASRLEIKKKIDDIKPWGDFSIDTAKSLMDNGIRVRLFSCSENSFNKRWEDLYTIEVIGTYNNRVYFILFHIDGDDIPIDVEEVKLPERSLSGLSHDLAIITSAINDINYTIDGYADNCIDLLKGSCKDLEEDYNYDITFFSGDSLLNDKLIVLEGWVPENKISYIISYLEGKHILYYISPPKMGDNVPILLVNNRFSRLFQWIGNLFSLPTYIELDLTIFFAPFFMLFFGFCVSDSGYGITLFLAATIYKFWAKKGIKSYLTMVQVLSLSAILFGILSGSFFGISLTMLNHLTPNMMFSLALILGIVQVIFAIILRIVNIVTQRGFIYSIPVIGWVFCIISFILYVALAYFGIFLNSLYLWIVVTIALAMILLFTDYDRPILSRLPMGFFSIYLNITSFFADVLSYIRLFALGLSSSILGFVINDIAFSIKGSGIIGGLLFILFLLAGHTLNILISSLSAFVHPMRLTFVEFYKNVGFRGGGILYKPFKRG